MFAGGKRKAKPESSKARQFGKTPQDTTRLPKQTTPKMAFPIFEGADPKIWKNNCESYFQLYSIPEGMWVTAASLHFRENAAKWFQAYKQTHTLGTWEQFCAAVQQEFGADDLRTAMNELLELKQIGNVEDYTATFQALQFKIIMHNPNYDDLFFTPKYIMGLKDEIRAQVEPHLPPTVRKVATIARIQQGLLERAKTKQTRNTMLPKPYNAAKPDNKSPQQINQLWKDRQLRDYRRANGLCFSCGDKFVPGHLEVCPKRNKPQVTALAVNDLDRELSDETLHELAAEDVLLEEFGQLSINALSSNGNTNCIRIKAKVHDKVMPILLDSGSSHSFVSSQFVAVAKLPTQSIPYKKVKLANGE